MRLRSTSAGRRVLFSALYFSEGAPIGFIWWALPTKLRVAGVPVDEITALTSLLVLPWVFKFLWAPLVDILRSQRWTLRSWIITMQLTMGASLLPLMFLTLQRNFALVVLLLLLHAFAAATQDAAIDALSIACVPSTERGAINGWMQAGMLAGRALFGGGTLFFVGRANEHFAIAFLVATIWSSTVLLIFSKIEPEDSQPSDSWSGFLGRVAATFRGPTPWLGLIFALISAAGFEAVGAVAGPFMIDRGFSRDDVGIFFGIPVVVSMLSGALVGGYVSDKVGRIRSVAIFLVLFVVNIVALATGDIVFAGRSPVVTTTLLSTLYFAIGMFTAASYALFMDIVHPKLAATQFSAYMGATNGCEVWSAFAVGKLHTFFGYPSAFFVMAVVSLFSLPILRRISSDTTVRGTRTVSVER